MPLSLQLAEENYNQVNNFFIKQGYTHRTSPNYFDDIEESVTYQPDVYTFAAHLAERLGCTHIIDIGCGRARKLVKLYPRFQIIGVDFGNNLDACRQQYNFGTWIDWNLDGPGNIPLEESLLKRSVIVCADVIEHLANPTYLMHSLKACLDHAPVCILSTPERDLVRGKDDLGPPKNVAHIREWNMKEFEMLLISEGLKIGFVGLTTSDDQDYEKKTILAVLENNKCTGSIARPAAAPSNFHVVAITATHNEKETIAAKLQLLINQGLDVYVIDKGSTDATYDLAIQFKDRGLVGIQRLPITIKGSVDNHNSKSIFEHVREELCEKIMADWFLYLDLYEAPSSPWLGVSYKDAIYRVDAKGFNCVDHTVILPGSSNNDGLSLASDLSYKFEKTDDPHLHIRAWKNFGQSFSLANVAGEGIQFEGQRVYPYNFLLERNLAAYEADRKSEHATAKEKSLQNHYLDSGYLDKADFYIEYLVERLSGSGLSLRDQ